MNQEDDETTQFIQKYAETTKRTCMCTAVAVILIMVFSMSFLGEFMLTSILSKTVIVLLLCYSIYKNTTQTTMLKNQFPNSNNSTDANSMFDPMKMNVLCGYTFSVFLVVLLFSVLTH
jgi:hypothetical protein